MSLSDVKLDQVMIASLYRNNLVQAGSDVISKPGEAELKNETNPARSINKTPPETENKILAGEVNNAPPAGNNIKYLGKNQQQIAILVKNPGEVFLADNELNLLTKMLTACKLTLADVAIINIAQTPVQQDQIHKELNPFKIIMLGVESKDILLPMNFPEYRVQPHGPCSYLMSPGLSTMVSETETSRNVKTQLWMALKQLFGL